MLILTIIMFFGLLWAIFEQQRLKKRFNVFFRGTSGADMESLLNSYLTKVRTNEESIGKINSVLSTHAGLLTNSIQKVGFVRFNPFEDTGGNQSFSVALLDQTDSGLVITSMHGRAGTRIYGKPVMRGRSTHNLSVEEKKAIEQAISPAKKEANV